MKPKVSITLPEDLLRNVDAQAKQQRKTRSQIIEIALRLNARRLAQEKLDRDTIAYYEHRTAEMKAEDEALARASSEMARRRRLD